MEKDKDFPFGNAVVVRAQMSTVDYIELRDSIRSRGASTVPVQRLSSSRTVRVQGVRMEEYSFANSSALDFPVHVKMLLPGAISISSTLQSSG